VPTLTISLSNERLSKLKEIATHLGVSPEDLVRASVEELVTRPEEAFERVVEYVLDKNAELYRRLA
jgi:predicted transcriptional regulator